MKKKMKVVSLFLTALLATGVFAGCGGGGDDGEADNGLPEGVVKTEQDLIKNFQSDYTILLPETDNKYEKIAADELQSFLYQASGYQMPIVYDGGTVSTSKVISLGATSVQQAKNAAKDYSHLNRSGYNIDSTENGDILLYSPHNEGALYSVYGLLDYLIDFEAYSIDYTYFKKSTTVKAYQFNDYNFNPAFPLTILSGTDGSSNLDNLINCARQGRISSNWMGYTYEGMFWGQGLNCHSAFKIIDKSNFAEHPDWFIMNANGMRQASNLCYSNEEMMQAYIEKFTSLVLGCSYTDYFLLGNEDNRSVCTCPDCKEAYKLYGNATGLYCVAMNRVSRAVNAVVQEQQPGRGPIHVYLLGYFGFVEPPVNDKGEPVHDDVKLDPTLGVQFCQHDGCQSHAITDPTCPNNRTIHRQLEGWSKIASNLCYYGYTNNYRDGFLQQNDWDAIQENIRYMKEINCEIFYIQGNATTNGADPWIRLKNYLRSATIQNLDADYMTLAHNFFTNFFGSAGTYVEEYWHNLRNYYKTMHATAGKSCWAIYEYMFNDWREGKYWEYNWMKQQQDILNQAKETAENDPNLTVTDKKRILNEILQLNLCLEFRILKDYAAYYTTFEHQAAKQKFFDDCHSINIYDRSMFSDEGTPDNQLDF